MDSVGYIKTVMHQNPENCNHNICTVLFEALTVMNIKSIIFWGMIPCSVIGRYEQFEEICCLFYPEHRGGRVLKDIATYLPDYMVLQLRRLQF
jgi:hypothetical protein